MINIDGLSYLDVQEAAARLGVKPETLYAYVSRGVLRSYRQGIRRRRLYLSSEIDSLLALRPGGGEEASIDPAAPQVAGATQTAMPHGEHLPPADTWAAER